MVSRLLLASAATLSPKFVSLQIYGFPSGLLLAALACRCRLVSPKLVFFHDLHSGLLLAAAAALSPKLVSLHDFAAGGINGK